MRTKLHHTETHRTCSKCRQLLPLDAYQQRKSGKYAKTKGGRARYFSCCKECNRTMARERRARLAKAKNLRADIEALGVSIASLEAEASTYVNSLDPTVTAADALRGMREMLAGKRRALARLTG